jgi:hypothetical protein
MVEPKYIHHAGQVIKENAPSFPSWGLKNEICAPWWNRTTSFMHINFLIIYLFSVSVMSIIVLCFVWCLICRILIHDKVLFIALHDWKIISEITTLNNLCWTMLNVMLFYNSADLHQLLYWLPSIPQFIVYRDIITCLKYHILHIKMKCMKHMMIYTFLLSQLKTKLYSLCD